jgi:hypothetical protein
MIRPTRPFIQPNRFYLFAVLLIQRRHDVLNTVQSPLFSRLPRERLERRTLIGQMMPEMLPIGQSGTKTIRSRPAECCCLGLRRRPTRQKVTKNRAQPNMPLALSLTLSSSFQEVEIQKFNKVNKYLNICFHILNLCIEKITNSSSRRSIRKLNKNTLCFPPKTLVLLSICLDC